MKLNSDIGYEMVGGREREECHRTATTTTYGKPYNLVVFRRLAIVKMTSVPFEFRLILLVNLS